MQYTLTIENARFVEPPAVEAFFDTLEDAVVALFEHLKALEDPTVTLTPCTPQEGAYEWKVEAVSFNEDDTEPGDLNEWFAKIEVSD